MFKRILNGFLLTALIVGALAVRPAQPVLAQSAAQAISPEEIIRADGTLNAQHGLNGAVDLEGWDVTMDPQRGPLFSRQPGLENKPAFTTAFGNWEGVGSGSGVTQSRVYAILVDGSNVYVGGTFVDFANIPEADYLAKWDGANWSALGSDGSGNGALKSVVQALAMIGTDLYAGGAFFVTQGQASVPTASYVAKWNGSSWSGLGSNGSGGSSLGSPVLALAVSGTTLYVSGYFQNVNNNGTVLTAADYVAAWDGTNWSALGSNGASDGALALNSTVFALQVIGTDLFIGGGFTNVNNNGVSLPEADYIAKWDGMNWSALSSNGAGNGSISATVNSLAAIGTNLYVGGQFSNVNNGGSTLGAADYVAKWDGVNWSALGSNGSGNGSLSSTVTALATDGVNLYVGGDFQNVNNNGSAMPTVDILAKWDGSNWSGFGNNGAGDGVFAVSGTSMLAIGVQGSNVWVGGIFFDPNNSGTVLNAADHLARWDGSNWNDAGAVSNGSLANTLGGGSARVEAILVNGSDVYVGGDFLNISNNGLNLPAADYIAKWDGTNWSALGSNGAGNGSINTTVYALAMDGSGNLYVGGSFFNVNNNGVSLPTADYIAKWDGTNWSALGSNGASDGSLGNIVYALAISGSDLYVGGTFTNVNDNGSALGAADYIAKWNGTNWSALGSNGASDGSLNSNVYSVDTDGINIYVGGNFQNANNNGVSVPEADYIAKWDGANWSALGSNGASNGSLNALVDVIAVSGSDIYAGGAFTNVNNNGSSLTAADYIAKWDGTNWSALGSNGGGNNGSINSRVFSILVNGSDVYIGGYFTNVNNGGTSLTAADYAAKWDGANWSALGVPGQTVNSLDNYVYALGIQGQDLLVGGTFANVRNQGTTIIEEADYLAAYGIDGTAPTVTSIQRVQASPTSLNSVDFTVTFSEAVQNVDASDFSFTAPGISGATVTNVSGSGATRTVTVNTGSGSGTLRLDIPNTATIADLASNALSGIPYTSGQSYDVVKNTAPTDISLSASSLTENLPAGTIVGSFTSTDPDAGNTFTYTLVSGTGSDDNAAFSISGNQLLSAQAFNFLNKSSYSIRVRSTDNGGLSFEKAFTISITDASAIFADVPDSYWAVSFIERLYNAGITGGCTTNPLNYCPTSAVTRAQMAVFLLKGIHGKSYSPPAVGADTGFNDVDVNYWAAAWIKQLAAEGITSGCGNGGYCPENTVTRDQMAVFLLKAKYGSAYAPPAVGASTGFTDVPTDYWAAAWIKQLAAEAITGGCGGGNYCPANAVTRDQMAVFLVKTFNLP